MFSQLQNSIQGPSTGGSSSSSHQGRHGHGSSTTRTEAVKKSSPLSYPWRTSSERDHNDEHRLEDVFSDEISEAGGPDDNYHFEDGTFQYLEADAAVDDSFVARNLELYEDDGDMFDGEQDFPSSLQDH